MNTKTEAKHTVPKTEELGYPDFGLSDSEASLPVAPTGERMSVKKAGKRPVSESEGQPETQKMGDRRANRESSLLDRARSLQRSEIKHHTTHITALPVMLEVIPKDAVSKHRREIGVDTNDP